MLEQLHLDRWSRHAPGLLEQAIGCAVHLAARGNEYLYVLVYTVPGQPPREYATDDLGRVLDLIPYLLDQAEFVLQLYVFAPDGLHAGGYTLLSHTPCDRP